MTFPLLKKKKYLVNWVLVPIWTALLVLPFAGRMSALLTAGVGCIVIALWMTAQTDTARSFLNSFSAILSRISVPTGMPGVLKNSMAVFLLVMILLLVLPLFLNDYYRDILTLTTMYVVLALGLNVMVGQAGLLNLGYVAFYAIGAYTYAILSTVYGVSFWAGLFAGGAFAVVFAFLLGLATLKLRGDYFAIVTLGLGEITRIVLNNWDSLTGGPNGISRIGRPVLAGYGLRTTLDFYYLILVIALCTVFAMKRLQASRIGRAWVAIREDEIAAEAMGINIFRLKLLAFVIGSMCAGVVGVFFAAKMAFVSPESFTFFESVMILCMVVLGGMGSIPGIILGSLVLITLPEVFREFQDYRMLAFGAALVLMMIFRPQGLIGARSKRQDPV